MLPLNNVVGLLCLCLCAAITIPTCWSLAISNGYVETSDRARNESRIEFELYTSASQVVPEILHLDDLDTIRQSNFDPKLPTKFFAHGWNSGPSSATSARKEYFKRERCNFVAIDWQWFAAGIDYPLIILRNVPIVANNTAAFIEALVSLKDADLSKFHLIGFSAGSHVVGGAGALVTSGRIPRITGLDPAKPFLTLENTENRLDTTDAEFVDIIHTDAGSLVGDELGFIEPIGHVDFYPNGGTDQPGCICCSDTMDVEAKGGCDHGRAVSYFVESINSNVGFLAEECDTYQDFLDGLCKNNYKEYMGDIVPSSARGVYYLATNAASPYAIP